jgi:hypothetical protein
VQGKLAGFGTRNRPFLLAGVPERLGIKHSPGLASDERRFRRTGESEKRKKISRHWRRDEAWQIGFRLGNGSAIRPAALQGDMGEDAVA